MRHFRGLGYSEAFVVNFKRVLQEIDKPLLVTQADAICQACPYHQNGCRKNGDFSEATVQQMDRKVLNALNLTENTVLSIRELNQLIDKTFDSTIFRELCGECAWFKFCTELDQG
jgi:hypothetical protein